MSKVPEFNSQTSGTSELVSKLHEVSCISHPRNGEALTHRGRGIWKKDGSSYILRETFLVLGRAESVLVVSILRPVPVDPVPSRLIAILALSTVEIGVMMQAITSPHYVSHPISNDALALGNY